MDQCDRFCCGLVEHSLIQGEISRSLSSVGTLEWMKCVKMLERDLGVFYMQSIVELIGNL